MINALNLFLQSLRSGNSVVNTETLGESSMEFKNLINAIGSMLTADNIGQMVNFVEKLIALGESIKNSSNPPAAS